MHMDLESCVPQFGESLETGWLVNSIFAATKKNSSQRIEAEQVDSAMRLSCWQTQMRTVMITRHEMFETSNIGCSA